MISCNYGFNYTALYGKLNSLIHNLMKCVITFETEHS